MFIDPTKPRATQLELRGMAQLAAPIVAPMEQATSPGESRPPGIDDAEWERRQAVAGEKREREKKEDEQRRVKAMDAFAFEVNRRLERAYQAGAQQAVSGQAQRAIAVRGYVLLGVIAAVVAMPLLAMALSVDPERFGSYIAPITGIAGTVVGYWFGTAAQSAAGQSQSQTERQ